MKCKHLLWHKQFSDEYFSAESIIFLMVFKNYLLSINWYAFSANWTPKPTFSEISWETSSLQHSWSPRPPFDIFFPIFSPFDKWYRIREAKCDEKIHINKRLSGDKDVSLKRMPWWVVDNHTAVILYLFLLSDLTFMSAELCWVEFLLALAVTVPAKFQIELKVSRWVSVRRRLTDIWGFSSNRDSVAFFVREIFPKHDP